MEEYAPFFSVVIPTYNRINLLPFAVQSVKNQIFTDYEVIIVDDGSTDGTYEYVSELYSKEENIKIFRIPNSERGAARNKGIEEAKGKYILFLDSDDELYPTHLSEYKDIIQKVPGCLMYATSYELVSDGQVWASSLKNVPDGLYDYSLGLKGNSFGVIYGIVNDRSRMKLFKEERSISIFEDWVFFMENLNTEKLYFKNIVTCKLNEHPNRSMRGNANVLSDRRLLATQIIIASLSLSEQEKNIINAYSYYFCAIHYYIDGIKDKGFYFLNLARQLVGMKYEFIILYIKLTIGKSFIEKLKRLN